jgi:Fe-S-cluster containining protein
MRAFCLSIHAKYRCRHSGACCTAGWPIPIDAGRVATLRQAGVAPHTGAHAAFVPSPRDPSVLTVATSMSGACVFFDAGHGRLCTIHRDAGEALMPSACRNFPRIALRDSRGVFVTLSHYCPTAARLLLDVGDITIVEAPPLLTLSDAVEGLDATGVLPPLLRPGMLTDLDGYGAWEREAVAVLNRRDRAAEDALAVIRQATSDVIDWRPGAETLADRVLRAFARATSAHRPTRQARRPLDRAANAFLAAHLFGNWVAYQNGGPGAVVEYLGNVLALLRVALSEYRFDDERADSTGSDGAEEAFVSAVRSVDLRVRHTGDRTTHHVGTPSLSALRRH